MPNLLSYLRAAYWEHTGIIISHNWEWAPRTAPIILDWVVDINWKCSKSELLYNSCSLYHPNYLNHIVICLYDIVSLFIVYCPLLIMRLCLISSSHTTSKHKRIILLTHIVVVTILVRITNTLPSTQSRIIGAVRGAHSQLWGTTLPVFSSYAPRKFDKRFGTPCNCLIYREKIDLHAERLIYREKESLYAERNVYYPYCNNVKKIVLRASICFLSSYFLFVDTSLTIYAQLSTFAGFVVQNYRVVDRSSYKMNIRPPFPPVIRT